MQHLDKHNYVPFLIIRVILVLDIITKLHDYDHKISSCSTLNINQILKHFVPCHTSIFCCRIPDLFIDLSIKSLHFCFDAMQAFRGRFFLSFYLPLDTNYGKLTKYIWKCGRIWRMRYTIWVKLEVFCYTPFECKGRGINLHLRDMCMTFRTEYQAT